MRAVIEICLLFFLGIIVSGFAAKMNIFKEWKYIDYVWDSPAAKDEAIRFGYYNMRSPILLDVDRSQDGRTFVTVAKTKGVPASLGVVSYKTGPGGPLINPYPNWSWHKQNDCNSITNVYRIKIDECNRLWVIDNGIVDGVQLCPTRLLVFNLNTNKVIYKLPIHAKFAKNPKSHKGFLVTPIVVTEGKSCLTTKLFISDVEGNGLVVYNFPYAWRLELPNYEIYPYSNKPRFAKSNSILTKDSFGLALSPRDKQKQQYLFVRPHDSAYLQAINVNNTLHENLGLPYHYYDKSGVLSSQSTALAFNSESTLFVGLTKQSAIGCFNMHKKDDSKLMTLVAQDYDALQFVSGIKVIWSTFNNQEEIWVSTNLKQKIVNARVNPAVINFRILKQSVAKLIENTDCEVPPAIDIR